METIKKEIRQNTFTHHSAGRHNHHEHHHGEGHHHNHQSLIDALSDCSHLIFRSAGWGLIENLRENNITPICTHERDAETAVQKLLKGELEIIEDTACAHH